MTSDQVRAFEAGCPDCHAQCGWCAMYRWIVWAKGCMRQFQKSFNHCPFTDGERGRTCATCGGSRRVRVTQTMQPVPVETR